MHSSIMQVLRLWMLIVCFERRGDCSLFLRVVALEMDEMGEGRGGRCLDVTLECTCRYLTCTS